MTVNVTYLSPDSGPTGVSGGPVGVPPAPGPERQVLNAFMGKWITEGHAFASSDAQAAEIFASDLYEWVPGGFFVVHSTNSRTGEVDVGGVESIRDAAASKQRQAQFFRIPGIRSQPF